MQKLGLKEPLKQSSLDREDSKREEPGKSSQSRAYRHVITVGSSNKHKKEL
jgi:hypothetical protein